MPEKNLDNYESATHKINILWNELHALIGLEKELLARLTAAELKLKTLRTTANNPE